MTIENVLASVAVKDIKAASKWYAQLLGRPGEMPMPDLAEWQFPRGGWLQCGQQPLTVGNAWPDCTYGVVMVDTAGSHRA